jgi:hypothetical protein
MGCGGSKTSDEIDESSHKLATGQAFDKDAPVDFSKNPNSFIANCTNYYKKQDPGDKEFKDDKFPPEADTVFGKIGGNYTDTNAERRGKGLSAIKVKPGDIEWKHAKDIWGADAKIFGDKLTLEDIKIGEVADAYFVATLSALAEFPALILQLFKTVSIPEGGKAIQIAMQIDGDWKIVPVDDMFPVNKNTGKPIFSDAPTKCLWGVFLEKAWAKANGGYANIVCGYPREVFEAFTPFTTIPIEVAKENKTSLWNNIKGADQYNCIMTCSIREGTPGLSKVGLLENHSFSLVSAFERKVGSETLKLMKIRNPFGEGEWNGDWSDKSAKWTAEAKKAFPEFDDKGGNDGIFWIDFDNFCKYFQIVSICVPLKPLSSTFIKVDKEKATKFNVMKIKVEGDGILSVAVYKKNYRFHRKIQPDQEVIENLILAKCEGDKFEYLDSAYNETMSTSVKAGEYICIYNVDYKTAGVAPRKYAVTISGSVKFKICELDADDDHSLLKCIMLPKIESLPKYKPRFENKIVLFTGNRFEQTAIGFFYVKNQNDDLIHFKPNVYFKNIKSIDGDVPAGLKMKKDDRYLYLGNRVKAALPFQTGGNGKTSENAISGEVEPKLNEENIKKYLDASDYKDVKITFEC